MGSYRSFSESRLGVSRARVHSAVASSELATGVVGSSSEVAEEEKEEEAKRLAVVTARPVGPVVGRGSTVCTLVASPGACPLEELINLRAQAEAMAKQERLFEPRSKNWLSWEAANEARVAAIGKYNAATHPATKTNLLRDCLVLAFHTLQGKRQQKPEEFP